MFDPRRRAITEAINTPATSSGPASSRQVARPLGLLLLMLPLIEQEAVPTPESNLHVNYEVTAHHFQAAASCIREHYGARRFLDSRVRK